MAEEAKKIKVTLVKSLIGTKPEHRACVRGLGLRRLPKRGFVSLLSNDTAEVRLGDLQRMEADVIDLAALKAYGVVPQVALRAKVILAGAIQRKVVLKGIGISKGARAAIQAAGG